ncbi:hypothetical protein WME73_17465 [Sorangium sp. So ce302]|uniref:hypothetical protein n=1 Tax=Sorangium sp. So ce302 TaxID=3133297 RepID=UPI003F617933
MVPFDTAKGSRFLRCTAPPGWPALRAIGPARRPATGSGEGVDLLRAEFQFSGEGVDG